MRRLRKRSNYSWGITDTDGLKLTPSLEFPAIAVPTDSLITERWDWVQNGWLPRLLTIAPYDTDPLAEWQVQTAGTGSYRLSSIVNFPAFVSYYGLPVSIFFAFSMNCNKSMISSPNNWVFEIDASQLLVDAVLSPLESKVSGFGAYFSGWLKGIVRELPVPTLTLEVDALFQEDQLVPEGSGTLVSEVLSSLPQLEIDNSPTIGLSEESCITCQRNSLPKGWVLK